MKRIASTAVIALILMSSCGNKMGTNANVLTDNEYDELYFPMDSLPIDSDLKHQCVSEDGQMKFVSWNTGLGGTCPDYGVICIFKTDDGEVHRIDMKEQDSEAAWVCAVHSIKKNDGSTFYIADRSHSVSSCEGYEWLDAYMINGDSLKVVSVYDGGDDLDDCGLEICYSIPEWYFTTNGEGYDWLFEYDAVTQNLYVPETTDGKMLPRISDRYRVYHFDGDTFVSQGIQPHKGLHKSLHEYRCLESFFRTKNHIVRIDRLDNGALRYTSWKANSSISEKPELIIVSDDNNSEKDVYTFKSNGMTYLCKVEENIPTDDEGIFEHHEYLIVKKGDKIVLKEEII